MAESYSERHLDPREALAYREKHHRSPLRRLSHRREHAIVRAALGVAMEHLPDVLPEPTSPRLLDLPCGAGRFAPLFRELAHTYVAADHSPHMLELCRRELEAAGGSDPERGQFQVADARHMPFPDDSFDLACCIRLIHHFRDPAERTDILREFRRVNRGPLVLTFLDAEAPKQWIHTRRLELALQPNRRAAISLVRLRAEAGDSDWSVRRTWSLSGLFSGQAVALLLPRT